MTFRGNGLIVLSRESQDDCWLVMLFALENSSWERGTMRERSVNYPLLQLEQTASTLVMFLNCFTIVYSQRYDWLHICPFVSFNY